MGELNKFLFLTILFLYFFKYSSEQIIIPINPINDQDEPTIVTRETFTVQSNDGTPIRVTRIGFHKNSKNLNGGGMRLTPLDLMRLMDDRIDSIFEEIISQRIGLNILYNNNNNNKEKEENKEEDNKNKDNKTNDEEKDKNKENQEIIDDKEFELDEKEENTNDKIIEQNKTEEIKNEEIKNEEIKNEDNKENKDNKVNIENKNKENKENKNNKIDNNKKEKKEKKSDDKKKTIGKLKVNADTLKPKKKKKKLSTKEIIFSRICKYIFYSIILFTIYILIRKLLELLDIIDPETNKVNKDVKVNNNQEEKKDDEIKKKENDIIINKKKENNKLN